MRKYWSLANDLTFLNHGSYGACPDPVMMHQSGLRAALESDPVRFYERWYPKLHRQAREALGKFVDADAHDLALVSSATVAVNTILRAHRFAAGDEIVTTNHIYGACRNALDALVKERGVTLNVVTLPFPVANSDVLVKAIEKALTPKTRMLFVDHVTSPTAMVMPVASLVALCKPRNIDVLIDGAHAPGMLDISIRDIGATYYVGNCHKWMCAPKGTGFFYVQRDRQEGFRPLVISHGTTAVLQGESRFEAEFAWYGTDDCTPVLSITKAIELVANLYDGGWPSIRTHNRKLVLAARAYLLEALELGPAPVASDLIGSMAVIPLDALVAKGLDADKLHDRLLDEYRIQVPVTKLPDSNQRFLRISAQLYNSLEDYEKLKDAIEAIMKKQAAAASPAPAAASPATAASDPKAE